MSIFIFLILEISIKNNTEQGGLQSKMEEVLLFRLKLLSEEVKKISDLSKTLCYCTKEELTEAEILRTKLSMLLQRLNGDLINYFKLVNQPSSDDIGRISEIQLQAEGDLAIVEAKLKLKNHSNPSAKDTSTSRLPKLSLPEFDGTILNWHQFWDQFSSNIDSRNIADVDKLLYLKTSLKGDAKKTIDGLETTNRNYQIALTTLRERYGKPSHLIDAHYAALSKLNKADKTTDSCRRTLNELERHFRILEALDEDVNHNHLRHLIFEKFPEDVIYELKLKVSDDSIIEIRKHLELIITAREDASRITNGDIQHREEYTVETLHTILNKSKQFKSRNERRNSYGNRKKFVKHLPSFKSKHIPRKRNFDKREDSKSQVSKIVESSMVKKRRLNCVFCNGNHFNDQCDTYKSLNERLRRLKLKGLCYMCFNIGHHKRDCTQKLKCVYCKGHHHRALCPTKSLKPEIVMTISGERGFTALQTAVVVTKKVGSTYGKKCRILFDSGSQRSYITLKVAKELNLEIEEENNLSVFTFGSNCPRDFTSPVVKFELESKLQNKRIIYANVVPMISQGVPYPQQELRNWENREILADDGSLSDQVDILIGNDYYHTFMSTGKKEISENLFLVESEFGWILSGRLDTKPVDTLTAVTYFQTGIEIRLNQPDLPIDKGDVSFLWDLESIGINDSPKASREEEAINNFNETTNIIGNRYTVSWPWNTYPPELPSNYGLAYGRLVHLLKRSDKETLEIYNKTLEDQIDKGIIEIIKRPNKPEDHPIHYLPHHGVTQKGKPIRIVYDASAKIKDEKSLNQCLYCGPTMLTDLTSLLIRFRSHRIALSADVENAFLQIALHEPDRDVTRFLWVKDISKPPTTDNLLCLRFCRVPFGIISSPFILNATIKHHLSRSTKSHIKEMSEDIYVDNLVTGASCTDEAIKLYKDSIETFQQISMNLREWNSNSNEFMQQIPESSRGNDTLVKILGLDWNLEQDTIKLRFNVNMNARTKREVLKVIASNYDPCGYSVPYILSAKVFFQKLWKSKIKWDTLLSEELLNEWSAIRQELDEISKLKLHRSYLKNSEVKTYQLHCFTDASMKAYAAVVYLSNGAEYSFVIGKSRLVPLKDQENCKIPRLELLGVLIGSRLIKFALSSLKGTATHQILWTDSQIVIDWFNSNKLLPPFVARRIEEIKRNKDLIIRYVPSKLNTADVATRPNSLKEEKDKWLAGPKLLLDKPDHWPSLAPTTTSFLAREDLSNEKEAEVGKKVKVSQGRTDKEIEIANVDKEDTIITNKIQDLKKLQTEYFPNEVKGIETSLKRNLGLFIDVDGLLRCKGRLKNTNWSYDKRYPILIPKNCEFTNEMIMKTHRDNYHVGANHTLSIIRESFWIVQGKSQVQKILRKCPRCVKHNGGPFKLPPTPALPPERVNYTKPFTFVGVDYMGPLLVNNGNGSSKRWICLFTCLAVRAIHLEVVQDLTAEEGLLALRRMISSRGVPTVITSDNAQHFKLLSEILSDQYCVEEKINWKFIPQLAPWFGGFYERLVGMVKNCMKKTLQKHLLKDTQLVTVVKEIEAVINTRPLTCIDSELEHILKPSDFLTVGKCITMEASNKDSVINGTVTKVELVKGWKRALIVLQEFKEMFLNRYLPSLRERYRHSLKEPRVTSKIEPEVGQVVQIKGENRNREGWKVGKIISLSKGTDGLVRVAKVKVGNKEFIRSISHLYPLEIDEEEAEMRSTADELDKCSSPVLVVEPKELESVPTVRGQQSTGLSEEIENICRDDIEESKDIHEDRSESDELQKDIDNESLIQINPQEGQSRQQRGAAIRALDKIREWTRSLLALF